MAPNQDESCRALQKTTWKGPGSGLKQRLMVFHDSSNDQLMYPQISGHVWLECDFSNSYRSYSSMVDVHIHIRKTNDHRGCSQTNSNNLCFQHVLFVASPWKKHLVTKFHQVTKDWWCHELHLKPWLDTEVTCWKKAWKLNTVGHQQKWHHYRLNQQSQSLFGFIIAQHAQVQVTEICRIVPIMLSFRIIHCILVSSFFTPF